MTTALILCTVLGAVLLLCGRGDLVFALVAMGIVLAIGLAVMAGLLTL